MPDFPRVKIDQSTIQQAMDAQGYTSARAARLDNLDAPVSTRLDTSTFNTTLPSTRAQLIDRLANMDYFDTPIEGNVTMDGTEKDVVLDEVTGNPQRYLEGYIDLSPMAAGDTIVIRQYMKITPTGSYVKYAEETYAGAQLLPLIYIVTKPGRYGIRITAQQTGGTYRTLTYQFFRRRV